LFGNEIRDEKDSAQIVIKYGDARRGQVRLTFSLPRWTT
jgi:hypothetical protein